MSYYNIKFIVTGEREEDGLYYRLSTGKKNSVGARNVCRRMGYRLSVAVTALQHSIFARYAAGGPGGTTHKGASLKGVSNMVLHSYFRFNRYEPSSVLTSLASMPRALQ